MPSNTYTVVVKFQWTDDHYTFNDGADDDLQSVRDDPIGGAIDAYLERRDGDEFTVQEFITQQLRNKEDHEAFLRGELLGER